MMLDGMMRVRVRGLTCVSLSLLPLCFDHPHWSQVCEYDEVEWRWRHDQRQMQMQMDPSRYCLGLAVAVAVGRQNRFEQRDSMMHG